MSTKKSRGEALIETWGLCRPSSDSKALADALTVFRFASIDGSPCLVYDSFLYIGSIGSAYNRTKLQEEGITHVICAADSAKIWGQQFSYLRVSIHDKSEDSKALARILPLCFAFIDHVRDRGCGKGKGKGKVLVHCFQGVSRSAAIICAYIMYKRRVGLEAALGLLRRVRPSAQPNAGFMRVLQGLEEDLADEDSDSDKGQGQGQGGGGSGLECAYI
jgi:atypical dual specificity phosphatase